MKYLIAISLLAFSAFAQEGSSTKVLTSSGSDAAVTSLQVEVASLRAQLALLQQNLEICVLPEVMRVRLAAFDAMQKAKPSEKPEAKK